VLTLEHVCAQIGYPKTIRGIMAANLSRVISICGPIYKAEVRDNYGQKIGAN